MKHPLQQWREDRGMSVREFAKFSGVSYGSISRIERDRQAASQPTAQKIVCATGGAITLERLCRWHHPPRVYFVQAGLNGPIKAGVVFADLKQRMTDIQINCAYELILLGTLPGGFEEESKVQRDLAPYNMRGEWFRPHPAVLDYIRRNVSYEAKDSNTDQVFRGVRVRGRRAKAKAA